MAPEIHRREAYCLPVDWYSFGVAIFEMLTGNLDPCRDLCSQEALHSHVSWSENLRVALASVRCSDAKDLITQLLTFDAKERLGFWTASALLSHPFYGGVDWDRVNMGTSPPPLLDFDRRLGHLDLLGTEIKESYDHHLMTEVDDKLFAGF